MSEVEIAEFRLTMAQAREIHAPTTANVVRRSDGEIVETITLLRYAGRYTSSSIEAFAIKNANGKFQVRAAKQLGLTEDSQYALIAPSFRAA